MSRQPRSQCGAKGEPTDQREVTPETLTDAMIWQVVKAAADTRNATLLAYCTVALRQRTAGGLRHAQDVLCRAINSAIDVLIVRSSIGQGLADITTRGIDARLRDLDQELHPQRQSRRRGK